MSDSTIVETTQHSGDVSVGRNVAIGGKLEVNGNATVHHNLKVEGWVEADNIKGPNKGVFLTLAELRESYPSPKAGWFAGVGATTPFALYVVSDGAWTASGGQMNVTFDTEAIDDLVEDVAELRAAITANASTVSGHTEQIEAINDIIDGMKEADEIKTVTANSSDTTMGTVTGGGTRAVGSVLTLVATPNTGYHFVSWNDGNTNATRTVTVTEDAAYTATFAINTYTITVASNSDTMGTVSGGGTYTHGNTPTIVATPYTANGYHFVGWYNGNKLVSSSASYTFRATADLNLTAVFAVNTYTFDVKSANDTMGTASGSGSYTHGAEVTLIATANEGYVFVSWNDGNTEATRTVDATADAAYVATFAAEETGNYDYYVGWTNEIDEEDFAGFSQAELLTGVKGYKKSSHPSVGGTFSGAKTFYLLYRAASAPMHGWLNRNTELAKEYQAEEFLDTNMWSFVHEAVEIDGESYLVIGIGDNQFDATTTIEVWFAEGWE